ncbi:MAG: hypothetical protein HFG48_01855 [Bacilli bacterium]|nr:hypothetical protein [Bacilli bacterium]
MSNNINFLVGIRLDDNIVLPADEPQRSIFKNFMFVMLKKVQKGEWTKQEFNNWKKTLIRVDEEVLCRVPTVFLQAIENDPEINKETAILVRSFNLKNLIGSLGDDDITTIINGVKSHSIIDVLRDITTKGFQVTSKIIDENFKNCGLDSLEIVLEQLKDEDDNPIKSKLKQTFDSNFEYLRCISGVNQVIAIAEERLIPNAISVILNRIRSEQAKKEHEIKDYQNSSFRTYLKTYYGKSSPWNDSSNR